MFRLRLSQEVQVELICPQAKINFPTLPFAARLPSQSFVAAFSPTQHQGFIFFCTQSFRLRGLGGEGRERRLGLDILYQHVATWSPYRWS